MCSSEHGYLDKMHEDSQHVSETAEPAYELATRKRVAVGHTRPRIYDPETGKYLKDEIVQTIEESMRGEGVVRVGSFDDYLKLVSSI